MASDWELETPEYLRHGLKVFNCFMLGDNDDEHIRKLVAIANYAPEAKILDMGCGIGYVPDEIRKKGFDVSAVTNSLFQYEYAMKNYPETKFFFSDMCATPFDDASFDVVQWLESIGYVEQYQAFQEAFRVLRKGGRAMVKDFSTLGEVSAVNAAWSYNHISAGQMVSSAERAGLHFIKGFCFFGNTKRFYDFYYHSRLLQDIHQDNLSPRNGIPFWYEFLKL